MTSPFEKYAAGALIGEVVGTVTGLLFAPRSGAKTREIIRQEVETKSRDAVEALKEKMVELSTELEDKGKETLACFKEGNQKTPVATS